MQQYASVTLNLSISLRGEKVNQKGISCTPVADSSHFHTSYIKHLEELYTVDVKKLSLAYSFKLNQVTQASKCLRSMPHVCWLAH